MAQRQDSQHDDIVNGAVLTFFSTASSVGKTLISCNMASELARQGRRVCLVDLDLQFGDICNYLNLKAENTIADAQRSLQLMGDSCQIAEYCTPYEHAGVRFDVMAGPAKLAEAYNMQPNFVVKVIQHLQKVYEFVVVDTTSMFSAINLKILDISTIVTFLGVVDFIPTIKNMKIGADTLSSLGYSEDKIRLVLNRSDSKTRISMDSVRQVLGQDFYFQLPNDFRAAAQSIKDGIPLVLRPERTELGAALRQLVGLYTSHNDDGIMDMQAAGGQHDDGGFFGRLFH